MSKREKVLEVMAKHPSWGVLLVAKKAKCSPSYAHLVRKQVKEAEYNAAKAELEAESTPEEQFWESVVDSTAKAMSVLGMELEAESTPQEHKTSVLVAATGLSAEVETSYLETNDLPPAPVEVVTRSSILSTARSYITRDRQADHGDAEDNFSRIAGYWSLHTGVTLTATDVAVMMALLKVARIKQNPQHVDNWVDGAGYFACGGEIANQ